MTEYTAPIARIIMRYLVGAVAFGSTELGDQLATDPDLIFFTSLAVGVAVEGFYAMSKRFGWQT